MILSTRHDHPPIGWASYGTGAGDPRRFVWGIELITKGRAMAGAFIGGITGDVGTIGTTELADESVTTAKLASLAVGTTNIKAANVTAAKIASLAVGTTLIAGAAVTDAKRSYGWSTLTGTVAGTLPSVPKGYLITNPGTTKGLVFTSTGTRLSVPTAGDQYRFNIDSTPGTSRGIFIQSTAATFDGTNKNLRFGENDQFAVIEAVSATRWVVTSKSTGVTLANTT